MEHLSNLYLANLELEMFPVLVRDCHMPGVSSYQLSSFNQGCSYNTQLLWDQLLVSSAPMHAILFAWPVSKPTLVGQFRYREKDCSICRLPCLVSFDIEQSLSVSKLTKQGTLGKNDIGIDRALVSDSFSTNW